MTSTFRRRSWRATTSFSSVFMEAPGDCSPSRSVVSKMSILRVMCMRPFLFCPPVSLAGAVGGIAHDYFDHPSKFTVPSGRKVGEAEAGERYSFTCQRFFRSGTALRRRSSTASVTSPFHVDVHERAPLFGLGAHLHGGDVDARLAQDGADGADAARRVHVLEHERFAARRDVDPVVQKRHDARGLRGGGHRDRPLPPRRRIS